MKTIYSLILTLLIIANCVSAAEPDGWEHRLVPVEFLVGTASGIGLGLLFLLPLFYNSISPMSCDDEVFESNVGSTIIMALAASSVGAWSGVVLTGETYGVPTSNKPATYIYSALAATVFPVMFVLSGIFDADYIPSELLAYNPLISSIAATLIYNVVKIPQTEPTTDNARLSIHPYVDAIADSGDRNITTYGVEVNF